jgi:hypothetical protein
MVRMDYNDLSKTVQQPIIDLHVAESYFILRDK